jgi:enoyl-CoA hydratase/carnithine racemase
MSKNLILSENPDEGILRLTLNSPETQNTLSREMIEALIEEFTEVKHNKSIRVIVLTAQGPVFCAGHNLKEMKEAQINPEAGKLFLKALFDSCSSLMQLIVNHPKPVIAKVDGVATAAGCQLVASCDLAYASDSARFATPGVNIGLFCSTPMVALSRNIKNKHAMEMLLTGDMIDASKAREIGLINDYFQAEILEAETLKIASKIAGKSGIVLKTGKQAFYNQNAMNLSDAYEYTSKIMTENMLKHDAVEGINAFIDKRHPEWKEH